MRALSWLRLALALISISRTGGGLVFFPSTHGSRCGRTAAIISRRSCSSQPARRVNSSCLLRVSRVSLFGSEAPPVLVMPWIFSHSPDCSRLPMRTGSRPPL